MVKGLDNLGNTCYLNSALQCLSHVPELSNRLIKTPYNGPCELTRAYSNLIHQLWKKQPARADMTQFYAEFCKKFPRFANGHPHDVQEVVLELLDVFEKSLGVGFVQSVFNGIETQTVIFPKGTSAKEYDFTTIVLAPETSGQTLDDLMQQRERHNAFSGYIDDSGNTYHVAVQTTSITKWPQTLVFSFNQYDAKRTVRVPRTYKNYVLFGLIVHQGSTHGGHYYAFVKHRGVWRLVDDTSVVEMEPPEAGDYYMAWYKAKI